MHIGLLACDHVADDLVAIAGDYADMFERLFARHAPELSFVRHDVVGGDPLPDPASADGWLVTGSRHGVHDQGVTWIDELADFVRRADAQDAPMVGICFGHQLFASALGGEVQRAGQGWGVGVHEASVEHPTDWMQPASSAYRLLVSHQDQVVRLPEGATRVATSRHAPVAAFQRDNVLGFQGHPEFTPPYAEALLSERVERIGAPVVEAARASLDTTTDHPIVARWIARFFTAYA
ncbi:glutamine amidotransferase-related protein [Egicoccus halophilus]|uniref:GMP synthase n=1 Tax=Egicoccus halophilus TaxID=1670830 RepID=A0A8J3AA54_9ACTN|nr:gamma-glutamyl-gamma-aminobutyrate hydrolase family protein [Egicoccus halophilus]GGI08250.1 GMP synthase [Egicoccus halophilus]